VPQFPDPNWLSLSEARTRAFASFADHDPAAVLRAIRVAIYDGKIETRGRCKKWFGHVERVGLDAFIWDPSLTRIQWDRDRFVRATDSDAFLFQDVQLRRRDWEKSLGQTAACDMQAIESSPATATNPPGTAEGLTTTNEPAPVKTASYSDVKKAVQKLGPAAEAELWEAVRGKLAPNRVSRQQVRCARDEIFGKPGRTGRPKSSMKKSP
jgi:hypothetical protein